MADLAPIFDPYAESGDNGAGHVMRTTPALLASPTTTMIADKKTIWQRNVAPFDRWVSNGTALMNIPVTDGTSLYGPAGNPVSVGGATGGRFWAFLGDSITFGTGSSNAGTNAYPIVAVNLLGAARVASNYTILGTPGFKSSDILAQLPALLATGIQTLVILIGTNDAATGVSTAVFSANITSLLKLAKNAGVKVYIGTVPSRASSVSATIRQQVDVNSMVVRLLASQYGATVFASEEYVTDPATGLLKYDSGDGLHPNDQGHYMIAKALFDAVTSFQSAQTLVAGPSLIGMNTNPMMQGGGTLATGNTQNNGLTSGTAPAYSAAAAWTDATKRGANQQIEVTAAAATVVVVQIGTARNCAVGDHLLATYKAEIDDVSGTWDAAVQALTAQAVMFIVDSGAIKVGVPTTFSRSIGPTQSPYVALSTSVQLWAYLQVPNGTHVRWRFGECEIINQTLAGVAYP